LELGLLGARPLRKDIHNQLGAINDLLLDALLEVAGLRGRERIVEDDDICVGFGSELAEFVGLALANEKRRIGLVALLQDRPQGLPTPPCAQAPSALRWTRALATLPQAQDPTPLRSLVPQKICARAPQDDLL
jgi:hypothetical protein